MTISVSKVNGYLAAGAAAVAVAALVLGSIGLARGPQRMTIVQQDEEKQISVVGEGKLDVAPDAAAIELGVRAERPGAKEAQAAAAETLSAVVETLKEAGVSEGDIKTSRTALEPVYDYSPNGPPRLVAYRASGMLTVTTQRLDEAGHLVDAAVQAGANEVRGVAFVLKDVENAKAQALDEALEDARRQADQIARKTGSEILEVKSVSVLDGGSEPPVPYTRAKALEAADASMPVLPGTMEFAIRVQVRYLLR